LETTNGTRSWLVKWTRTTSSTVNKINAFTWIEDPPRAQATGRWIGPRELAAHPRVAGSPRQSTLEGPPAWNELYWVTDQAEYATDVMFEDANALKALYEKFSSSKFNLS